MALVNRNTGETSRTEAQRALSTSLSVPQTSTPPQSSSTEVSEQVLSWQTINHMNKLEVENSVLKKSLTELRQEMNALEEKQNLYFKRVNETLGRVDQSLSGYDLQIARLESSNEQLSGSLNSSVNDAMSRVYNNIHQTVKVDLGFCIENLERKIKAHLNKLEELSKRATNQYEKSMNTLQTVSNNNQTLVYLFLASLAGHLIGCIQWIASFF